MERGDFSSGVCIVDVWEGVYYLAVGMTRTWPEWRGELRVKQSTAGDIF